MSVDNADIRLLRLFMSIVETGGFTAAQAELNLTLSTISGRISALEQRLGVELCKRGRSGFSLTEEGRAVYEESSRLFAALDRFNRRATGLRTHLGGILSIGLVDNTISDPNFSFSKVIARFCEAAPAVGLNIKTNPPGELLRDVVSGTSGIPSFLATTAGLMFADDHSTKHSQVAVTDRGSGTSLGQIGALPAERHQHGRLWQLESVLAGQTHQA